MSIFKRTQRKDVKKAYRARNWREYEAGLRNRESLAVWISLTDGKLVNWNAPRPPSWYRSFTRCCQEGRACRWGNRRPSGEVSSIEPSSLG